MRVAAIRICAWFHVAVVAACGVQEDAAGGAPPPDVPGEVDAGGDSDAEELVEDAGGQDMEPEDGEGEDAEPDGDVVDPCPPGSDGDPCDDDDPCTLDDSCSGGTCAGTLRDCDDFDICTDDACDPATGECSHELNTAPCDDGNPCTMDDACAGGSCLPGAPRDCSAWDDDCNTGRCDTLTGACEAAPVADGSSCDDGDPCSVGEYCTAGECGSGAAVDCRWLDDDCNTGRCDGTTGDCYAEPVADGTTCDDAVACTTGDRCTAGVCAGIPPDADRDLYYAEGCLDGDDCDDSRWNVNPGAAEGPIGRATCFDGIDNDCDGVSDRAETACGTGIDWANLDSPATVRVHVGLPTGLVRGRVWEPGLTEAPGPMPGLSAQIGYGPRVTDPTDNPAWTWFPADYFGQGGPGNAHDVFAGTLVSAAAGVFSYAYRYSVDGGTTWLYADMDGNGAAPPSNGIALDQLGTLTVVVNDHLVISEVVVVPNEAEFVELYNPTAAAVSLGDYYLYDATDATTPWVYYDLPAGPGFVRAWDFVARFPAGASIAAGARVVVSIAAAQIYRAAYGADPQFELCPGSPDSAVPNMVAAFAGSVGCIGPATGQLNNSVETLILFRWDGASDLVTDVDIVQWKAPGSRTGEALDKTGVARDGPDAGTTTSTYLADTPVASQRYITTAPHAPGESYSRSDPAETGERRTGGNGITGHDETSEDYGATWTVSPTATPGS